MWATVSKLATSLEKGSLKNILTGAGVMLASSASVMTAFSAVVSQLQSSVGSVSSNVLALAHLSGIDAGMSIILGAVVTRLTISSQKLFLKKAGS